MDEETLPPPEGYQDPTDPNNEFYQMLISPEDHHIDFLTDRFTDFLAWLIEWHKKALKDNPGRDYKIFRCCGVISWEGAISWDKHAEKYAYPLERIVDETIERTGANILTFWEKGFGRMNLELCKVHCKGDCEFLMPKLDDVGNCDVQADLDIFLGKVWVWYQDYKAEYAKAHPDEIMWED